MTRLAHREEEPYGVLLAAGRGGTDLDLHALLACAAAHRDRRLFSGGLGQEGAGLTHRSMTQYML